MFYILQNESTSALRRVPILLTDAATGTTAQTGIASTQIFPYVNHNGGSFAGGAGTIGEAGYGQYYYEMHPSEVSTLGLAGIHITAVGCRDYDAITQIAAFNVYSAGGVGISAADVWNYVLPVNSLSAELTLNNADYQTQTAQIQNSVWSTDLTGSLSPTAGYDLLTAASGGAGITAGDVWNYQINGVVDPNSAGDQLITINTNTANSQFAIANTLIPDIWNTDVSAYTSPSAGYDVHTAASGGSGISAADVWNYVLTSTSSTADATVGNIDSNVTTIQGNTSNIAGTVWNSLVASYGTNGTFGKLILRSDAANKTGDVTLFSSGGINGVDADMHRIANDATAATNLKNMLTGVAGGTITANLTGAITGNITGNLSGSVNSVTSAVTVATASMTGIAGTVWGNATRTITGGTITTVSDKTGYSLSGTQSFNLTGNINGNLSGSVGSVSGSVASVTNPIVISTATQASIANSVWVQNISAYTSGSAGYALNTAAGGGVALTAGDIWTYNSRTLTSGAGATAGDVWSYVLSDNNTAGADLVTAAASGNGITAGDIWTYNIGGITNSGTAGKQLNDAAVSGSVVTIVNGPYRLNSTAEGTDGRIDILQDSVQTIELMLVNAFGSPINISGNYTVSVDIYDEASSLVHSYTPTINYALGGILSFDIDTIVTAVIGRYSVVVSLTDGDVIQVGPLQILVRPL